MRWFPKDPERLGESLKSKKELGRYQCFSVYVLRSRRVDQNEADRINAQMEYVMTGDRTLIKKRTKRLQSEGTKKLNKKRKEKGKRKSLSSTKVRAWKAKMKLKLKQELFEMASEYND